MKLKDTENTLVLGLFLGVIGAISALILAYFANITKEPIKKMEMQKTNNALKEVLPAFDNNPGDNKIAFGNVVFYGALKDGKLVGIAGQATTKKGYSGNVEAMVGIELNGKIRTVAIMDKKSADGKVEKENISAVVITKQNETPGLGTVVCERKKIVTIFNMFEKDTNTPSLAPNPILDQFAGQTAGNTPWKVEKDGGTVKYITGATISSRAVTGVVYEIDHTFMANRQEIVNKLSGSAPQK